MNRWRQHWRPGIKELERLRSEGKIRGFQVNQQKNPGRKQAPKSNRNRQKEWIAWNLLYWCNQHALTLAVEHRFHQERAWRFDWAILTLKIAVEYEGLISAKSRHTTIQGFTGDTEKYNNAQALGWKVLRFTALNYKSLVTELNKIYENGDFG